MHEPYTYFEHDADMGIVGRGVEVKGATLTGLALAQRDGAWEARCVVDV